MNPSYDARNVAPGHEHPFVRQAPDQVQGEGLALLEGTVTVYSCYSFHPEPEGRPTRRVDDLVQAMGLSGISKFQMSKLRKAIDERVHAFLSRPLTGGRPYLWLDATYLKKGLLRRGLTGVKLVVSDAQEGLKAPIAKTFGVTGQRCRVHWM